MKILTQFRNSYLFMKIFFNMTRSIDKNKFHVHGPILYVRKNRTKVRQITKHDTTVNQQINDTNDFAHFTAELKSISISAPSLPLCLCDWRALTNTNAELESRA